ncbi:hypothetical protein HK097_002266 [Rhizophlyctis rosea]|uniref:DJ-1/PfpI domain-containing protein n=1 Tax=Rhizophlyctis rosea TaxID=64517 RepID=A0AAD5S5L2_9FUNG|nr:hypothetical protein HK097_002266 [Rhizophlyctis rosea]
MIIGAILYPAWELLDVQGPFSVLMKIASQSQSSKTTKFTVVGPSIDHPVLGRAHFPVMADYDYETCPQLDVLIVPGGIGFLSAAQDPRMLDFLRKQAVNAKFVTSVCTGSAVLAEAGLLEGKKATTNKAYFDISACYGKNVEYVHEARFVEDGKIITASGVSAGVDMGFMLGRKLFGDAAVDGVLKSIKYEPVDPKDDVFAKIHGRKSYIPSYLVSTYLHTRAHTIVPAATDPHAPKFTKTYPYLPFNLSTQSYKPKHLALLLFPGFDTLDVAGVLESFQELDPAEWYFEVVGVGTEVVKGGDSSSREVHLREVMGVRCDRYLVGDVRKGGVFPDGKPAVVLVPSAGAAFEGRVGTAVLDALVECKDTWVVGSGEQVARKFAEKGVVSGGGKGWNRKGQWYVAETGLIGITAALDVVQQLVSVEAARHVAVEMEIIPSLLPEGLTLVA